MDPAVLPRCLTSLKSVHSMSVLADKYWVEAAKFVRSCGCAADRVIAPGQFKSLMPGAIRYEQRHLCATPEVLVLHKGMLEKLGRKWIEQATAGLQPTFANEVFVVFSRLHSRSSVGMSTHFAAYIESLESLNPEPQNVPMTPVVNNRMAVYVGDNLALTRTIYDHKIYVDTRNLDLAPHILLDGYWEQWITNVFLSVVQPGMRVVEIGANMGWYSLLAGANIGPAGKLVSFEANPRMAEILRRNISINGFLDRAQVVNKAVFSANQTLEFGVYDKYMGGSSLFAARAQTASDHSRDGIFDPQANDKFQVIEVEAVTLDSSFAQGSKVDFIKIDAEGAEPHILAGANRLLAENKDVQIMTEFAPQLLLRGGSSAEEFYASIRALGFRVLRIEEDSSLVESDLSGLTQGPHHHDVILRR
jgi:FkbM family methyltransferase